MSQEREERTEHEFPCKFSAGHCVHVEEIKRAKFDVLARRREEMLRQIGPEVLAAITNKGPLAIESTETMEPDEVNRSVVTRHVVKISDEDWIIRKNAALRAELAEATAEVERVKSGALEIIAQEAISRGMYEHQIAELQQQLAAEQAARAEADGLLIETYRHVGNSSPKRHALPPGLRDRIRDYTKTNCAERAGWLTPGEERGE